MAGDARWTFPVAGENEYSDSFRTPRPKKKSGIHGAIDIYGKPSTAVVSPVAGVVMAVGVDTAIGGNWVQMRGDDGIVYYFAHMYRPPSVKKGQRVTGGSYLGGIGDSGNAKGTSPHLHFAMKYNGKPVNPTKWFKDGAQANPDNYAAVIRDPRASMANDPYFNPQETQPKDDPMRQNIVAMLETMSNAVAGGQRRPSSPGSEIDDFVDEPISVPEVGETP